MPEHDLIRAEALRLQAFFQSQISRGAPTKDAQLTAILGLAVIFLREAKEKTRKASQTGTALKTKSSAVECRESACDLEDHPNSNFILFCEAAMRPFCPATAATAAALSSTFKRYKTGLKDSD